MTGAAHDGVSPEQAAFFQEHGYLVLPGFADQATVQALLGRGQQLLTAFQPEAHPSVFSTTKQEDVSDEYFLRSANNVSYFLEEGALDSQFRLTRPKHLAVNKFGHGACT
jgi:phytanoyl-CoA hydroxylase